MKRADRGVTKSPAAGFRKRIEKYLKNIPGILGIQNMGSLEIHEMTPGSYNLNFHISVGA